MAWVAVAALTGTSLYLGFYHLNSRSIWLDESYTWLAAAQRSPVMFDIARGQGWHLLPYYLLLHADIAVFGPSPVALRAPSVIAGALSVPFLYLLANRIGGRVAALSACLLFVVSEPLVFWQQNARDYSFVVLLAVIATWAGVAAAQTGRAWAFATWAVILGAGCYTHPEVLFLVPVHIGIFLLWSPSNRIRLTFIGIAVVGALCLLPALDNASNSGLYKNSFLPSPNNGSATQIASFLASAASSAGAVTSINHALLGVTFFMMVIGVAVLGSDLTDRGCRPENLGLGLSLAWSVVPMLLAWIASETGRQAFVDRYLIVSLPAVALVVAQVTERLRPRALGLFVVVYLTIFHAGLLAGNYHEGFDDYRDATRMILTSAHPGDCVTFYVNSGRTVYDYYDLLWNAGHKNHAMFSPPQVFPTAIGPTPRFVLYYSSTTDQTLQAAQTPASIAAVTPHCQRIFILESHFGAAVGVASQVAKYQTLQEFTARLRYFYRTQTIKIFPGGDYVQVFVRIALPH